jgi:hypothetical protein
MPTYGLVFPILPGKEGLVREIARQLQERRAEYEESRARGGVSVERAYIQHNPDGSSLVVAYLETDRPFAQSMQALVESESPLDRFFVEKNGEATGINFRTMQGSDPELIAQWPAGGGALRGRGFAFAAPLQPGKAEAARAFAREAYVDRQAELAESRLSKKTTREEVFLNRTPGGDMIVVYLEAEDPQEGNRLFAESSTPYDRWFKDRCKELFVPEVDFDQPVPDNEEIFSATRGVAAHA